MNSNLIRRAFGFALSLGLTASAFASPETDAMRDTLCRVPMVHRQFTLVGERAPSDAEVQSLAKYAEQIRSRAIRADSLEQFLVEHPGSPWEASVRANLAAHYAQRGLFTRSVKQWEAAWAICGKATFGEAKQLGDYILTHWTKLLVAHGRTADLEHIQTEFETRIVVDHGLRRIIEESRYNYRGMRNNTQKGFSCGLAALDQLFTAVKAPGIDFAKLKEIPAPTTGFSLDALVRIGQKFHVEVLAVRWGQAKDIPVPSVVHWKSDHYASIIETNSKGFFRIVDEGISRNIWMSRADIKEEASGLFIIARNQLSEHYDALAPVESERVFGRGWITTPGDGDDGCGNGGGGSGGGGGNGGPQYSPCNSGANCVVPPSSGAGGQSACPCDASGGPGIGDMPEPGEDDYFVSPPSAGGMPVWNVSEPYINLWVHDEPMAYTTSFGDRIGLKLAYKQRDTRPIQNNFFNFGNNWECGWLSFFREEPESETIHDGFQILGGTRGSLTPGGVVDFYTKTTLSRIPVQANESVLRIDFPSGAHDIYAYRPTNTIENFSVILLSHRVNAHGRTNLSFFYNEQNNVVQLRHVVDSDGKTNTLNYTNVANPSLVTSITDPFTNTCYLYYHPYGTTMMLTGIVDVVGITSQFVYDDQGWMTELITPYGTNSFEHFTDDDSMHFMRALKVVDTVQATNIYLLRQYSGEVSTNGVDYESLVPYGYDFYGGMVPQGVGPDSNPLLVNNSCLFYRNSYHWNSRTAPALPLDLNTISAAQYRRAVRSHWLHKGSSISHLLSSRQDPSEDGIADGPITWYEYDGDANIVVGTNSQPKLIARVLPDGTTWYQWFERDEQGRVIQRIETYSEGFGQAPLLRTNTYVYNGPDLVAVYAPDNQLIRGYTYDASRRLIRSTNAINEVTYYTYNADGRLGSTRTPTGLLATNLYYSSGANKGWLQSRIDMEVASNGTIISYLRTNSYTYSNNRLLTHTDERGLVTTSTWDALGRLRRISYPDGYVTNIYNPTNLDLMITVDKMGYPTFYGYDKARRLTAVTNALGFYTLYSYCPCGTLDSVRDAEGHYESYTYDSLGRLSTKTDRGNNTTVYYYNSLNQLTNAVTAGGGSVTNWYNNQGRFYAASNFLGVVKYLRYDVENRITCSIDANGTAITNFYDGLGRLTRRIHSDGGEERFGQSVRGVVSYTNQLGNTTLYAFDAFRRKVAETNAVKGVIRFDYNGAGDLVRLLDANTNCTYWEYDVYGHVTNKLNSLSNTIGLYTYDSNGRVVSRITPARGTTLYRHDPLGNLTNVLYETLTPLTLRYDAVNRLTNMVDELGTTRYAYNGLGQITLEDGPWEDDAVSSTYHNGLRSGLRVPVPNSSPWVTTYGYDQARRLEEITSPAGEFEYDYVAGRQGLTRSLSLPTGAAITNSFDSVGRLARTYLRDGAGVALNSHAYFYNQAGQRTNHTRFNGDYVTNAYDKIGQLIYAIGREAGGASRMNERFRYGYDAAGNLRTRTNNLFVQNFLVDSLNQLTNVNRSTTVNASFYAAGTVSTGATSIILGSFLGSRYADGTWSAYADIPANGTNTYRAIAEDAVGRKATNSVTVYLPVNVGFKYDLNGNMLSDGRRAFDYDDENQLIRVTITNATKSEFRYDGKMRRRERIESVWAGNAWVTNLLVRYVYDGNLVVQERHYVPQPFGEILQKVVSYTRGNDPSVTLQDVGGIGGLLARTDHSTFNLQPSTAYYHADGNGNVTCLIDERNSVVARYIYDPYGNITASQGSLADANLYRFSSKEFHPQSELVYYLYRYYEPNLQRWVNRDPLGEEGGFNLYSFVNNNPVDWVDGFGDRVVRPGPRTPGGRNPYRYPNGRPFLPYIPPQPPSPNPQWPGGRQPSMCIQIPLVPERMVDGAEIGEDAFKHLFGDPASPCPPPVPTQPCSAKDPAVPATPIYVPNSGSDVNAPPDIGISTPPRPPKTIFLPRESAPAIVAPGTIIIWY